MLWSMCSEAEGLEREAEGDLHFLESTLLSRDWASSRRQADPVRVVHKFYRSDSENRHIRFPPRTFEQLVATVRHLRHVWENALDRGICYGFVMDRLMAVRQELVTHGDKMYSTVEAVSVLAESASLYSMVYRGCSPSSWWDEHMHEGALSSCLSTALSIPLPESSLLVVGDLLDGLRATALFLHVLGTLRIALESVLVSGVLRPLSPLQLSLPRQAVLGSGLGQEWVWKLLGLLRGGNPSGALRFISQVPGSCLGLMGPLCPRMVVALRMWRILLADRSGIKDDEVNGTTLLRLDTTPASEPDRIALWELAVSWTDMQTAPISTTRISPPPPSSQVEHKQLLESQQLTLRLAGKGVVRSEKALRATLAAIAKLSSVAV